MVDAMIHALTRMVITLFFAAIPGLSPLTYANNLLLEKMSGHWQGKYFYNTAPKSLKGSITSTNFRALFQQKGTAFTGEITETVETQANGNSVNLRATVENGEITDDGHIRFTKQYDGKNGWSHSVIYEGTLLESKTTFQIDGKWTINQVFGKFEMHRTKK